MLALLALPRASNGPLDPASLARSVALAALYATPGVLALLSRRRRRPLLAAGGAMGLALIPTSMSITPLLVIPSTLLLVAYSHKGLRYRPLAPTAAIVGAGILVAAASFLLIVLGPGTRCWTYSQDASGRRVYTTPVVPSSVWTDRAATTVDRGLATPVPMGSSGGGTSGGGCSEDAVAPVRALATLVLLGLFVAGAAKLGGPMPGPPPPVRNGASGGA